MLVYIVYEDEYPFLQIQPNSLPLGCILNGSRYDVWELVQFFLVLECPQVSLISSPWSMVLEVAHLDQQFRLPNARLSIYVDDFILFLMKLLHNIQNIFLPAWNILVVLLFHCWIVNAFGFQFIADACSVFNELEQGRRHHTLRVVFLILFLQFLRPYEYLILYALLPTATRSYECSELFLERYLHVPSWLIESILNRLAHY
jgi:hypothetical protein